MGQRDLGGFFGRKARLTWPTTRRIVMGIAMKFAAVLCLALLAVPAQAAAPHNIIIFVADGLRYGSVTADNMPNMFKLKAAGVDFTNSHSLFPTITTVN